MTHLMRFRRDRILANDTVTAAVVSCLLVMITGIAACGYLADKGKEPRGDENLPVSGVGKFEKQDFDCTTELVQPFIVLDPTSTPDGEESISGQPCLLYENGTLRVWYVVLTRTAAGTSRTMITGKILLSESTECRDVNAVVTDKKEVRFVIEGGNGSTPPYAIGAPSVLVNGGSLRMWFEVPDAQGNSTAIGYADSIDSEGALWSVKPGEEAIVVEANQKWEGVAYGGVGIVGNKGYVGSPTVVRADGRYRMWYESYQENGLGACPKRAIGHAWSEDGIRWYKSDAYGHIEPAKGESSGEVLPVMEATQRTWEFWHPDDPYGTVGEPCVIVHETPLRRLFYMYYTGNICGRIDPRRIRDSKLFIDCLLGCREGVSCWDVSIGLASSKDGLTWEKADNYSEPDVIANEINPIMNEKLAVSWDPKKPEGSSNVFCPNFIVNEAEPAVLEIVPSQLFIMLWHQVDYVNCAPPYPDQDIPGFQGGFGIGSGIGFAFVGTPPWE